MTTALRFTGCLFIGSLACLLAWPWDVAVCSSLAVVCCVLVWLQSGSKGKRHRRKRRTAKAKPVVKRTPTVVVKPAAVPELRTPPDDAWLNDDSDVIETWSPEVVRYTMDEWRNRSAK